MYNNYEYDKNEIKENLDITDVFALLEEFNAEPMYMGDNIIVAKTICHHTLIEIGSVDHKLYYYDNTHLFKCYTGGCIDSVFDIFELTRKVMGRVEDNFDLPKAIRYVAQRFGYQVKEASELTEDALADWKIFNSYDRVSNINSTKQEVELKEYDETILTRLPHPLILPWIREDISKSTMDRFEICYEPRNCSIIIPHRDINKRLIGVRQRALCKEIADSYGKYRPAKIGDIMYSHPLSFNLYGIDHNAENITRAKRAMVFEGEKSVLKYEDYFGRENNIAVACCGSSLIAYQVSLLVGLGTEEIIICFDRQYQEKGDSEFVKLTKNLENIHKKYGNIVKISFLFDRGNALAYKSSPIDHGKDTFLQLYREKVTLY